jgi:DNA-binding NtrC family response regulator
MSHVQQPAGKSILLIDRQDSWRERSARALAQAGFHVQTLDRYTLPPVEEAMHSPDLVVLGCASVGPAEQELIDAILHRHWPLVVLSTALPWHTMRALFRIGANDVTDKPYDTNILVATVHQALDSIAASNGPHGLRG